MQRYLAEVGCTVATTATGPLANATYLLDVFLSVLPTWTDRLYCDDAQTLYRHKQDMCTRSISAILLPVSITTILLVTAVIIG